MSPRSKAIKIIRGIKYEVSNILKKTRSSARKAGKGGTGITNKKVTNKKVTKRGLIELIPRNRVISRVDNIILI
jgi:hypothetical protein